MRCARPPATPAAPGRRAAGAGGGAGPDAARRLAGDLAWLADSDEAHRTAVAAVFMTPLKADLSDLREALQAGRISRASLPKELVRDWVSPNGRARAEATPKGDPNDEDTLRRFAHAVLAAEPTLGLLSRSRCCCGSCCAGSATCCSRSSRWWWRQSPRWRYAP